jgi:ABC-type Mn2+/Zn2+ transport system ATPase subunit
VHATADPRTGIVLEHLRYRRHHCLPASSRAWSARLAQHRVRQTIVVVLHDLNLACRFCDHLIAIVDGTILAEATPTGIVTPPNPSRRALPRLRRDTRPDRRHTDGVPS